MNPYADTIECDECGSDNVGEHWETREGYEVPVLRCRTCRYEEVV